MKKTIEKYTEDINSQYPQYSEYTSYCAEQLTDLLICDYNSFPSENKSTRYVMASSGTHGIQSRQRTLQPDA